MTNENSKQNEAQTKEQLLEELLELRDALTRMSLVLSDLVFEADRLSDDRNLLLAKRLVDKINKTANE